MEGQSKYKKFQCLKRSKEKRKRKTIFSFVNNGEKLIEENTNY